MWRFLTLAEPTIERVNDSSGRIGDVFYCAAADIGSLLARVPDLDRVGLAERLHESLGKDDYGFAAQIITSGSEALGVEGRTKLRELLKAEIRRLPSRQERENWNAVGWPRSRISAHLADLADTERDVDAYIEAIQLGDREHIDATHVAQRLIAASRPAEGLEWLDKDQRVRRPFDLTIADLRIAAFEALGKKPEAQALRWQAFEATLSGPHLREHLKRLPDFEDFATEQKALAHAATFPSALTALVFFVEWPELEAADRLVRQRISELSADSQKPIRMPLATWPARQFSDLDCLPIAAFRIMRRSTPSSRPGTVVNTGFGRSSKVYTSEVADSRPISGGHLSLPRLAGMFYCNCPALGR